VQGASVTVAEGQEEFSLLYTFFQDELHMTTAENAEDALWEWAEAHVASNLIRQAPEQPAVEPEAPRRGARRGNSFYRRPDNESEESSDDGPDPVKQLVDQAPARIFIKSVAHGRFVSPLQLIHHIPAEMKVMERATTYQNRFLSGLGPVAREAVCDLLFTSLPANDRRAAFEPAVKVAMNMCDSLKKRMGEKLTSRMPTNTREEQAPVQGARGPYDAPLPEPMAIASEVLYLVNPFALYKAVNQYGGNHVATLLKLWLVKAERWVEKHLQEGEQLRDHAQLEIALNAFALDYNTHLTGEGGCAHSGSCACQTADCNRWGERWEPFLGNRPFRMALVNFLGAIACVGASSARMESDFSKLKIIKSLPMFHLQRMQVNGKYYAEQWPELYELYHSITGIKPRYYTPKR
jgi:hypothetical protein